MTPRSTLARRLQALERTQAEPVLVLVASFVGAVGQVERVTSTRRSWWRQPGESVEQFRQRTAAAAMTCSVGPVLVLVEHNESGAEALHEGA